MARGASLVLKTAAGTSNHVHAVGARPLADIASFRRVNDNHNYRGTARFSGELECYAFLLQTARRVTRGAGLGLEAAAGTSYYGHAPKKRGLSSAQRLFKVHKPIKSNASRRAHGKLECRTSSLVIASAQAGEIHRRDMRRWLGVGGCGWHVAPRSCVEGERPRAGAAPFYRA